MRAGALVAAALLLGACGGGGGAGVAGSAPRLSDLRVAPAATYVASTPVSFNGTFDFADSDGDLRFIHLGIVDGTGATVADETLPVADAQGITQGTLVGTVVAMATVPDTYRFAMYATDAAGLRSNTLESSVRVAAYPWVSLAAGPTAREYAAAATLNGLVYLVGGQRTDSGVVPGPAMPTLEIYNPANNTWSTAAPMPTPRMGLVAVALNGKLYAVGGRTNGFTNSAVGTVEEFDPGTGLWRTLNPMPTPRYFAAGAVVNNQIVVVGGESLGASLSDVEVYNPVANSWQRRSSMPTPRGQLSLAELGGQLFAVGGYAGLVLQWTGLVEAYDPLTDRWAARASMPTPRAHLALAVANGVLLAAGGENVNRALDTLEVFDPATNAWSTKTPSTTAFTRAACVVANTTVWSFGDRLTLQYDPANDIR